MAWAVLGLHAALLTVMYAALQTQQHCQLLVMHGCACVRCSSALF